MPERGEGARGLKKGEKKWTSGGSSGFMDGWHRKLLCIGLVGIRNDVLF